MLPKMNFPPINHIEIRDGQARIVGSNVKVKMVISRLLHGTGATIEEVMEQYNLSRADVYAVLAYYFDHKNAIDRFFEEEERLAHELIPSFDDLKSRLSARLERKQDSD
jgi:uncharacterized protein (DUF433 family)